MARVLADGGGAGGPVLSNPSILGVDLQAGAEIVAGMVGTAWISDKLIGPLTDPLVSGFRTANNVVGQAIDGVATIGSAYVLSWAVDKVASPSTASMVLLGGGALGISKMLAALIPGLSLSARYPDVFGGINLLGSGAPSPAALPSGTAAPAAPNPPVGATIRSSPVF